MGVDDPQTRAREQLAEYSGLLQLLTERLHDLELDFAALQEQMIAAHAMLAALPTREPSAGDDSDIWADHLHHFHLSEYRYGRV